ncbi:hypothetical protein ACSFA3_03680 [Variovorax sp. RHLX14]|uniref:hypothetical protein n=1 Tax=Variovorax sp. RHLX14 TaxID=1259731 RepID=UPI003F4565A4
MKNPSTLDVNRFLERRGLWLSANATLTLVTLIVFLGITAGFVYALVRIDGLEHRAGQDLHSETRSATTLSAHCAHASVAFGASASMSEIRDAMRAAEGFVTYGPDEFGRFQIRLIGGANGTGIQTLRASPSVTNVRTYPECR